jgi:hypothetical protein
VDVEVLSEEEEDDELADIKYNSDCKAIAFI